MKHPSFLLILLLLILSNCANPQLELPAGEGIKTPSLLRLNETAGDLAPLHLVGKLEVFSLASGPKTLERSFDLNIQNSMQGLQLIPPEGIQIDGLPEGNYLYRISLFNRAASQKEDILLTTLEEQVFMRHGVENGINFVDSRWKYDFDDDGDGYANITELMNGHWDKDKGWITDPATDPKEATSHPNSIQSFKDKIGATAPRADGTVTLMGDSHAVSSGVLVNIIHWAADGKTVIDRITEFSRLDGSFEIAIKNSSHGDQLRVYAVSVSSKSGEDPDRSVSPYISPKMGEENLFFEVQQ